VLLRSGVAVINPDGVSGIRCDCCNAVRAAAVLHLGWPLHLVVCVCSMVLSNFTTPDAVLDGVSDSLFRHCCS
jgi:hypothetical protein